MKLKKVVEFYILQCIYRYLMYYLISVRYMLYKDKSRLAGKHFEVALFLKIGTS